MSDFKQTIQVKCSGSDMLPLDSIIEFQGKLKSLSDANMNKLKSSILKHGFSAPLFIWESGWDNKIIDGHQRVATLIKMREQGFDIPLIPVVKVQADNEIQAKEKLLTISSQYGIFDLDYLSDFMKGMDQDLAETIRLVDEEIHIVNNDNPEEDSAEESQERQTGENIIIKYSDDTAELLNDYNIKFKVK